MSNLFFFYFFYRVKVHIFDSLPNCDSKKAKEHRAKLTAKWLVKSQEDDFDESTTVDCRIYGQFEQVGASCGFTSLLALRILVEGIMNEQINLDGNFEIFCGNYNTLLDQRMKEENVRDLYDEYKNHGYLQMEKLNKIDKSIQQKSIYKSVEQLNNICQRLGFEKRKEFSKGKRKSTAPAVFQPSKRSKTVKNSQASECTLCDYKGTKDSVARHKRLVHHEGVSLFLAYFDICRTHIPFIAKTEDEIFKIMKYIYAKDKNKIMDNIYCMRNLEEFQYNYIMQGNNVRGQSAVLARIIESEERVKVHDYFFNKRNTVKDDLEGTINKIIDSSQKYWLDESNFNEILVSGYRGRNQAFIANIKLAIEKK